MLIWVLFIGSSIVFSGFPSEQSCLDAVAVIKKNMAGKSVFCVPMPMPQK